MDSDIRSLWWEKRLVAVIVCLLILGVDRMGWLSLPVAGVQKLVIPVERAGVAMRELVAAPVNALRFVRNGTERLANLEQRLAASMVDREKLARLEEENLVLRQSLEDEQLVALAPIMAEVVGRSRDELVVARGGLDAVGVGQSVLAGGVYIGRVSEVSAAVSRVQLVTHPQSKTAVRLVDSKVAGIVVGRGDGKAQVEEVLQSETIGVGELVETSGVDGGVPNLVIGEVEEIGAADSSLDRRISLRLPEVIAASSYVAIVKTGGSQ